MRTGRILVFCALLAFCGACTGTPQHADLSKVGAEETGAQNAGAQDAGTQEPVAESDTHEPAVQNAGAGRSAPIPNSLAADAGMTQAAGENTSHSMGDGSLPETQDAASSETSDLDASAASGLDAGSTPAALPLPADAGAQAPGQRNVIFYDGFEEPTLANAWGAQGCEPWSIEVAEADYRGAPAPRAGKGLLRTETRPGDRKPVSCTAGSTGHRAEIHLRERFEVGSDIWVGFSIFLPLTFDLQGKTYVMQIHGHDTEADGGCEGVQRVTPMTWLRIENGRAAFVYGQHARRGLVDDWPLGTEDLGQWHDIVVHYRPAPDASGRLEVWWDGALQVADSGMNMCPSAQPYLKLGLYQSDHNIAYYDELRVGDPASAGYADVAP